MGAVDADSTWDLQSTTTQVIHKDQGKLLKLMIEAGKCVSKGTIHCFKKRR